MATIATEAPASVEQAAQLLAAASADGRAVQIDGARTKAWGPPVASDGLALRTTGLDEIVAYDSGDMTATLQAGVPLARAQELFRDAGQMLALDPPVGGAVGEPTIGGIVASGDDGPLRHRYGGPRDLVVGATVVLGDGTVTRSGGTVIKNVAGYDVAKLMCGAHGTLGLVLSVNVRLHPVPAATATAVATTTDPGVLAAAAVRAAQLPAELESLDVSWRDGAGRVLARCGGRRAADRARRVASELTAAGLDATVDERDEPLWDAQRHAQRADPRGDAVAVVRVLAAPSVLGGVLEAVRETGGSLVGRALGRHYVRVAPDAVTALRARLPARATSALLDAPAELRASLPDPWGAPADGPLALMRAIKRRFDPAGTCNPGRFVV